MVSQYSNTPIYIIMMKYFIISADSAYSTILNKDWPVLAPLRLHLFFLFFFFFFVFFSFFLIHTFHHVKHPFIHLLHNHYLDFAINTYFVAIPATSLVIIGHHLCATQPGCRHLIVGDNLEGTWSKLYVNPTFTPTPTTSTSTSTRQSENMLFPTSMDL